MIPRLIQSIKALNSMKLTIKNKTIGTHPLCVDDVL